MAWYNASWQYRKKITIDNTKVSANETDFPVLVSIASDTDFAADARSDGFDFVVTRSDGTTECAYDRRYFNDTTGQLILFFKANSISSSVDTDFYIYYGNSGQASDKATPTTVWSDYAGVWPLNESSGTRADQTSNNNDLTDNNTVTGATGKIYQASDFERDNSEFLSITDANQTGLDITGSISFDAWVKYESLPDATNTNKVIASKHGGGTTNSYIFTLIYTGGNQEAWVVFYDNSGAEIPNVVNTTVTTDWTKVTYVLDFSTSYFKFYINGSFFGQKSLTKTSVRDSDATFQLGSSVNGTANWFDGLMEEATIFSGVRSSDWITTEYNNQNSPSTFYTLGSEEYVGDVILTPDTQTTTLSLPSPTVTADRTITTFPSVQEIVGSPLGVTVTTTSNVTVLPTVQSIVGTPEAPTVSVGDSATPATIESTLTAESPTVSTGTPTINGYNAFKVNNLKGIIDLDDGTLKVMLVDNTYTFDEDTHEYIDDITEEISGTGYTAGGATLTGASVSLDTGTDTAKFDATDVSWSSATFTTAGAIIYQDSGTPSTSPLIAYYSFGSDVSPSNENLTIQWGDGIITYT